MIAPHPTVHNIVNVAAGDRYQVLWDKMKEFMQYVFVILLIIVLDQAYFDCPDLWSQWISRQATYIGSMISVDLSTKSRV